MKSLIRDTLVVLLLSGLVAVAVNLFRPNPLPWVADQDYETMVPCPEPLGEVDEITVESDIILDDKTLLIDAREKDEFELGSVPKAVSVPFDWLDPVPEERLQNWSRHVQQEWWCLEMGWTLTQAGNWPGNWQAVG